MEELTMETGMFTLHKNSFLAGRKLVIKERKKPCTKPVHYLIQVSPFQYISSLFPVSDSPDTYTFDFEKKLYSLRREADKVEIEALP
jgi:hypothetical protein